MEPTRPFRRIRPGAHSISAGQYNRLIDELERVSVKSVGSPRQRPRRQTSASAAPCKRFQIKAIKGDYLEAYPFDGVRADTAATVLIAKPPQLRASLSSYDGVTYSGYAADGQERTASGDSVTETQVVTPRYVIGAELYATLLPAGGTGVTVGSIEVQYLDDNRDARAFAESS